jgi:hypothetical protein
MARNTPPLLLRDCFEDAVLHLGKHDLGNVLVVTRPRNRRHPLQRSRALEPPDGRAILAFPMAIAPAIGVPRFVLANSLVTWWLGEETSASRAPSS